jgi:hypothetical protein
LFDILTVFFYIHVFKKGGILSIILGSSVCPGQQKYYKVSIHKWSLFPISVLCSKNNPRNIKHMRVVIFFVCLDIE